MASARAGVHVRISIPFRFPKTVIFPAQTRLIADRSSKALTPIIAVPVRATSSRIGRDLPDAMWVATGPLIRLIVLFATANPVERYFSGGMTVVDETGSK